MFHAMEMVYNHYGVDKYLYGSGLSVDPDYRGYGLGKDILKIRYGSSKILCNCISQDAYYAE